MSLNLLELLAPNNVQNYKSDNWRTDFLPINHLHIGYARPLALGPINLYIRRYIIRITRAAYLRRLIQYR